MKKTLIALAVAGVIAAPAAMAEVTVYGLAHISLDNVSSDAAGDTTLAVESRASRVGVKAAEDLGGGLTAVAQMEFGVDMDNDGTDSAGKAADLISARNMFIGLAGSFGTVAVGTHDTPYKMSTGSLDVFADTAADYNAIIGTPAGLENRAQDAVAYLSPDMNGFSVQAAIVAADVDAAAKAGDPPGKIYDDASTADATSIAVQYKAGPLFVSAAMENFEEEVATALQGAGTDTDGKNAGQSGTRLGVGYDFGVAKVGFVYENASDVGTADDDYTAMLVNAAFPMGSNTIIAEYGMATKDPSAVGAKDLDTTLMAVGLAHGFSKTTSGYVAYGAVSADAGTTTVKSQDTTILTAGMVVKF